ncbi:MAG: UDP-N-acetylmuramoyl-L-alanine--D-glutamate ligase [Desulfovibrio sp.]|jgi:UDP-N-acetylmuramoylalanine--D-glutamate ligase|nr:UDP-N-acetylmuramoyl-L-alanine--D-glutamate ligase [Desulfovibrio sp.]
MGKELKTANGAIARVKTGDRAAVVGAGLSGLAAARLLRALGVKTRLLDRKPSLSEESLTQIRAIGADLICGEHKPEYFKDADLVVISPGVPYGPLAELLAQAGNPPLIGETELALPYVQAPILAFTGTSGKTTTVSLAAAMLEQAGRKVFLGGNIGTPLSDYVLAPEQANVLVLELSSFQLQGIDSLRPAVACILNLAANHLDQHRDMEEYRAAKFSIFTGQTEKDLALLPPDLVPEYRKDGFRARLEILRPTRRFPKTRLIGLHNAANAEAAFLAVQSQGVSEADAARAVAAFRPLPHRLENLGEKDGILYVNDSKSTTVDALRAALESFDAPLLLLAGGRFKGGDLQSLRPLIQEKVKAVALFGAGREVFSEAFAGIVPLSWDPELPPALRRLEAMARAGEVILLSPATASFDLYRNYKERGDHFRRLAQGEYKENENGPRG